MKPAFERMYLAFRNLKHKNQKTRDLMQPLIIVLYIINIIIVLACAANMIKYGVDNFGAGIIFSFFCLFVPVIGALTMIFYKEYYKNVQIIILSSQGLQSNVNDNIVLDYIDKVTTMRKIPNQPYIWSALRETYSIVNENENISKDVQERLRTVLLSKGVEKI